MVFRMSTQPNVDALFSAGEPFAAGFCEQPGAAPIERYARAWRRWLEHAPLPAWSGGTLYPCGIKAETDRDAGRIGVWPDYSFTFHWSRDALAAKAAVATPAERCALDSAAEILAAEKSAVPNRIGRHTVGGNAYTHAIVGFDRVLREGLDGYGDRIRAHLARAGDDGARAFCRAMLDLLDGVRAWHGRLVGALRARPASPNRDRLLQALERVPFQPARTFAEAMIACNFIYYLDGCDNPGRLDQALWPYYRDPADAREAEAMLGDFADNVSANNGWSAALGGTDRDGGPAFNALTSLILRATRGRFRPSLELRVRRDMPDSVWEAAFDALASGNGQPAFYNEEGYLDGLRQAGLGIAEADLSLWNGGGCTETMLHGCSNVGSLDAGFNLPLILNESLSRSLRDGATFASVLETFEADARREIGDTLDRLNEHLLARAGRRPQPVRSLLVDDCVDRCRDFNDGGARYNWSVVNVAGLANVADALEALREVVFERGEVTPDAMRAALADNFAHGEPLRRRLGACARFGNDQPSVDTLAVRVADCVYGAIEAHPCARGGRFLPSHIMFETYATAGAVVGTLPDGRRVGEPLADSVGPVQGRDQNGPTAMLQSVARLPLPRAIGTPVLNVRLGKESVRGSEARSRTRAMIEAYFRLGGLQLQFSLLDREELLDALEHPERHENLIVRIGGYSAYFNKLSPDLKQEVIKRTEYVL